MSTKVKESLYETLPIAIGGVIFLFVKNGLLESLVQWIGAIGGTIAVIGILFFIDLFMIKLSWKFMRKDQ